METVIPCQHTIRHKPTFILNLGKIPSRTFEQRTIMINHYAVLLIGITAATSKQSLCYNIKICILKPLTCMVYYRFGLFIWRSLPYFMKVY